MEDNNVPPPPAAEGVASSAAPVIQRHNNDSSRHPLEHVVLDLPLHHITSYLSGTSVAFLALAIDPTYSSNDGNGVAGASNEALNALIRGEGERGRWAVICLERVDWINDDDVGRLLSLVVNFNATALERLTIRECPRVNGSGLYPLIRHEESGLMSLIFHDNGLIPRRSSRLAGGFFTPFEAVENIFGWLSADSFGHCLDYIRIPLEWAGLHAVHCSSFCCREEPIQRLFWCHFCRKGSFCERSAGKEFVFCEESGIAACMTCIRHHDCPPNFAIQCSHNNNGCIEQPCNFWCCACGCGRGHSLCYECDSFICHACILGEEYCIDIEYDRYSIFNIQRRCSMSHSIFNIQRR